MKKVQMSVLSLLFVVSAFAQLEPPIRPVDLDSFTCVPIRDATGALTQLSVLKNGQLEMVATPTFDGENNLMVIRNSSGNLVGSSWFVQGPDGNEAHYELGSDHLSISTIQTKGSQNQNPKAGESANDATRLEVSINEEVNQFTFVEGNDPKMVPAKSFEVVSEEIFNLGFGDLVDFSSLLLELLIWDAPGDLHTMQNLNVCQNNTQCFVISQSTGKDCLSCCLEQFNCNQAICDQMENLHITMNAIGETQGWVWISDLSKDQLQTVCDGSSLNELVSCNSSCEGGIA